MQSRSLLDESGRVVCESCEVAASMGARVRGLLGRKGVEPGHGMLIEKTGSIHTVFMAFPIDAVFLDRTMAVRRVVPELRPWRAAWKLGARSVLELRAGEAARVGLAEGSRLTWQDQTT
ncbi:MAG TPA: DUF192 domain-containing protein [Gaiellaceae bacterium]|nr:DUF192 domain-containing protein [Gaiellaceae bacterium]